MAADPFDDLLELEDGFYKEGYDAGVADSTYAGLIEGKVFGIEKGYEKALELGKMHGRAIVWQQRLEPQQATKQNDALSEVSLHGVVPQLAQLPDNARLRRHIESLLAITDATNITKDNSDDAVSEVDDRISKAQAKAKIIANVAGESLNPVARPSVGIEDATGLSARH